MMPRKKLKLRLSNEGLNYAQKVLKEMQKDSGIEEQQYFLALNWTIVFSKSCQKDFFHRNQRAQDCLSRILQP